MLDREKAAEIAEAKRQVTQLKTYIAETDSTSKASETWKRQLDNINSKLKVSGSFLAVVVSLDSTGVYGSPETKSQSFVLLIGQPVRAVSGKEIDVLQLAEIPHKHALSKQPMYYNSQ